ncbi:MAG: HAD-IA family hydrolase [Caulobacteraceae bacterium]|nr:HAD-IA family hydrolase [Caulobacteraceae bacterium]
MPIKALMVDVDGVLLVHPHPGGWSANLERDLGISAKALQDAFFIPHFEDIVHGRAALRERLEPVLADLAPDLSVEDLLTYWFEQDFHPQERLLSQLAEVRGGGVQVHLATVQEHERAKYLWSTMRWSERFDAIHYAADLGWAKPAPGFFRAIEARTGFGPVDLAFIDDKPANVEAAQACGWRAEVWTGSVDLRALMPELSGSSGVSSPPDGPTT